MACDFANKVVAWAGSRAWAIAGGVKWTTPISKGREIIKEVKRMVGTFQTQSYGSPHRMLVLNLVQILSIGAPIWLKKYL
jgi:hypothetical protein